MRRHLTCSAGRFLRGFARNQTTAATPVSQFHFLPNVDENRPKNKQNVSSLSGKFTYSEPDDGSTTYPKFSEETLLLTLYYRILQEYPLVLLLRHENRVPNRRPGPPLSIIRQADPQLLAASLNAYPLDATYMKDWRETVEMLKKGKVKKLALLLESVASTGLLSTIVAAPSVEAAKEYIPCMAKELYCARFNLKAAENASLLDLDVGTGPLKVHRSHEGVVPRFLRHLGRLDLVNTAVEDDALVVYK